MEEVVQRNGDGSDIMPDRNNTYSHVKIISISDESVVIHWRYLPTFVGGNPHLGVEATNFVDEYFTINPNGKVIRTIKQGTVKIDDWRDPSNMITQSFFLNSKGIKIESLVGAKSSRENTKIRGAALVSSNIVNLSLIHI